MVSLSPEDKLDFLLHILATSADWKPDYGAVATRLGINTNANAQRRFKSIVEADKKFILKANKDGTKIVENSEFGSAEGASSQPQTPKSRKRAKNDDDNSTDGGVDDVPKKKRGRPAKVKTKESDEGGDNNEI